MNSAETDCAAAFCHAMLTPDGRRTGRLNIAVGKGLNMRKAVLLGAVALLATAGLARADGLNLIEFRQTGMDLQSSGFAGIRAVVAAKGDIKTLEAPAKALQRWAALIPAVYPKGTETGGNTKALPEVWSDAAGFQKAAAALGEASGKLAELAKTGDADAVAAQVKLVGAACSACHNSYKAK